MIVFNDNLFFFLAKDEDIVILEEFLGNQSFARRKGVCCEIEKSTFKVNGARMSLCHMRREFGGHNEFGTLEEEIEEISEPSLR